MTQALALQQALHEAGHTVVGVALGTNPRRRVPTFFSQHCRAPLTLLPSPTFVTDGADRGVRPWRSVLHASVRTARYRRSLHHLHALVTRLRPDVVVNFYEPLWGLYRRLYLTSVPSVCIGHQYLMDHPAFPFPRGLSLQRAAFRAFTRLTAYGSQLCLALSFRPLMPYRQGRLRVIPPLLRPTLFRLQPQAGDHLLVYLVNAGYATAIERWHQQHPEVPLHCFWDRQDAPMVVQRDPTLTFHRLNDATFLDLMARSRGLVSTAGFESICEAMYLGKPAMMVPVGGHYEQQCNALDAEAAGAGLAAPAFDLDAFLAYLPQHRARNASFQHWVHQAPQRIINLLKATVRPQASFHVRSASAHQPATHPLLAP